MLLIRTILLMIFWPIGLIFLTVIGPIIWIYLLIRALPFFMLTLILHAFASRPLFLSSTAIEFPVGFFSQQFVKLWISGKRMIIGDQGSQDFTSEDDYSEPGTTGERSNDSTSVDFIRDLVSNVRKWIFTRLIPAFFVCLGIITVLAVLGVNILELIIGRPSWVSLATWCSGWFLIGIMGIPLLSHLRNIVTIPLVLITMIGWSVIGLAAWIPRIFVTFTRACILYLCFIFAAGDVVGERERMVRSLRYYSDGFQIILSVLTNPEVPATSRSDTETTGEMKKTIYASLRSLLYFLAYIPAWFIIKFLG